VYLYIAENKCMSKINSNIQTLLTDDVARCPDMENTHDQSSVNVELMSFNKQDDGSIR
jgi:hypothetical protein